METIRIVLDLEQEGFANRQPHKTKVHDGGLVIGGMPLGTREGKPTVMIGLDQGGNFLIAETTLALFLAAADALKAKYGDPREPSYFTK